MKNEQKKNYVQPEMTVLDYGYRANVLFSGSCEGVDCAEESSSTDGEPVELN
ncbi:hypothetical protein [Fibrobacter sp. UWB5]|uniref:hypothetical protein n=1 Tax=Fibrobacter sp. UWB5 TaxID=1964360 RepID=UPI00130325E4|nr:hypothetical protein [Fibrobacter sp. UWB5]